MGRKIVSRIRLTSAKVEVEVETELGKNSRVRPIIGLIGIGIFQKIGIGMIFISENRYRSSSKSQESGISIGINRQIMKWSKGFFISF